MKKSIFLIIWARPNFYQTLIFLANHLSKKGYKVSIYCIKNRSVKILTNNLNFSKNCKIKNNSFYFKTNNFLLNILNLFFFIIYCLVDFLKKNPKNVIFFNQKALYCQYFFNFFKKKNDIFIYHNFDFEHPKNIKVFMENLKSKIEIYLSNYSDYFIFPSKGRADAYKKYIKDKNKTFFYFQNCFPINFKPKISNKLNIKYGKMLKNKKIICQLGSIGPTHFLKEIILSSKYLPKNYIIIIGGVSVRGYASFLKSKVKKLNLANKILIIENISDSLWFEILSKSSIGLCFYQGNYFSHQNMAGTSQKFNNYLFFNKPMLVNKNYDFKKFKKRFNIYNMLNPQKPKEIANNINSLLNNKKRYSKIKKNMFLDFKKELNFERQFQNSYHKILNFEKSDI